MREVLEYTIDGDDDLVVRHHARAAWNFVEQWGSSRLQTFHDECVEPKMMVWLPPLPLGARNDLGT